MIIFRYDKEIQLQLFKDEREMMISTIESNCKSEFVFKAKGVINQTLKVVFNYQCVENIDADRVRKEVLKNLETLGFGSVEEADKTENSTQTDDLQGYKIVKFGEPIHRALPTHNKSIFVGRQVSQIPNVAEVVSPQNSIGSVGSVTPTNSDNIKL